MEMKAESVYASERLAVQALLQVQEDLRRTLLRRSEWPGGLDSWVETVSMLLVEVARGRVYLERLQRAMARVTEAERRHVEDVRLANELSREELAG